MPAIAREKDGISTGHGCSGTSTLKASSQRGNTKKVYANGEGISCLGDPVTAHTIESGNSCVNCPSPVTEASSGTVKIGDIGVCRKDDDVDSNGGMGIITGHSPNVNAGG